MTESSVGHAVAVAALAPLAAGSARTKRLAREEEEALALAPALPRPPRPAEPPRGSFDSERFWPTLWVSIPVCLIFVGNWVSDKTIFESGYPWVPMLLLPVFLALVVGYWSVLRAIPAGERYREELSAYEAAVAAAERRDAEREEIRDRFARRSAAALEGADE